MKKKRVAYLNWLLFGFIGGHKVYIEDKLHYLLWYWLLATATGGIAPLVSLFFIPSGVRYKNAQIKKFGW